MNAQSRGLAALAAQVEHYRLIFRWPERSASLLLPALLVASLSVHAFAFYLFQVAYPPTVTIAPPPAQVTLLTPATPEGAALLRWVQVQDPATAASLQEVAPPKGLGEVQYTPSYATIHTFQMEVEAPLEPIRFPAARSLLDLSDSKAPAPDLPRRAVPSSLSFSEGLSSRDAAPDFPLHLPIKSSVNLRPTVFLVGIDDRGEVRYCFLQTGSDGLSSGDPKTDEQAEALLRAHPFGPSETPLQWGFATFTWGAEAYAAAPSPAAPTEAPAP